MKLKPCPFCGRVNDSDDDDTLYPQATVNINLDDIDFVSMSSESVIEFVVGLDLQFQDIEFTLELIAALIKSLKSDFTHKEIKNEMRSILKTLKDSD